MVVGPFCFKGVVMRRRSLRELRAEEARLSAIVWYHRCSTPMLENGELDRLEPEHRESCLEARAKVEGDYPEVLDQEVDEFEWGMLHGELSAVRWAMGDDWGDLDT